MTDRAIFNRRYTDFTSGSQQVWLVNGAGVTTSAAQARNFTAGSTLIQGQPVYASGTYVLPASAASGVAPERYNVIGLTAAAALTGNLVTVNLDDIAVVSDVNITADSTLVPGQYYYLSKYTGEITRYSTASGTVTAASGYAASVVVGIALSTTELHVELEPPTAF